MSNIFKGAWGDNSSGGSNTGSGNPPGGNDLERRVEKLESTMTEVQLRLVRIETRLEQNATKADIQELAAAFHKAMNEQTWKFVAAATGLAGLLSGIVFAITKHFS